MKRRFSTRRSRSTAGSRRSSKIAVSSATGAVLNAATRSRRCRHTAGPAVPRSAFTQKSAAFSGSRKNSAHRTVPSVSRYRLKMRLSYSSACSSGDSVSSDSRSDGTSGDVVPVRLLAQSADQLEHRLAVGVEVPGQGESVLGLRQAGLDDAAIRLHEAAEHQVGEDLLLDVLGQAQTDEVAVLDHREPKQAGVGGRRGGVRVVDAHQPLVVCGDAPAVGGQHLVDDPRGPLVEPVRDEDLRCEQHGLELLVHLVENGDRRSEALGAWAGWRGPAEDRVELGAVEVGRLHPADDGDQGLHEPQPVGDRPAREDPVAVRLPGGVSMSMSKVLCPPMEGRRPGRPARRTTRRGRGSRAPVSLATRCSSDSACRPTSSPSKGPVSSSAGSGWRNCCTTAVRSASDTPSARTTRRRNSVWAGASRSPVQVSTRWPAVCLRDERRAANNRRLDVGPPAVERPVEQVCGASPSPMPRVSIGRDEAADDVERQFQGGRQVPDDGQGPQCLAVQDVAAQGPQHEVELGERQTDGVGEADEPVDPLEPLPRLELRVVAPDERVLLRVHRHGRALVDEEGGRQRPLGLGPVAGGRVGGRGAQVAEQQFRQLGGRQPGRRQEPVDGLQRGEVCPFDPVGGLDRRASAAGVVTRSSVSWDRPRYSRATTSGSGSVAKRRYSRSGATPASCRYVRRRTSSSEKGMANGAVQPRHRRVGVFSRLGAQLPGQHLVHDVQVRDLGEGVGGVERDVLDLLRLSRSEACSNRSSSNCNRSAR